jgi:hypothetical protein
MEIERVGIVTFLNIHDYVSDVTGQHWDGCLASLNSEDGKQTAIYTTSQRLQAALVLGFHTKSRVRAVLDDRDPFSKADADAEKVLSMSGSSEGPFRLKAVYTLE